MISQTLKKLRTDAGLKQSYLAYKLGMTQGHVSELERGDTRASIETLELYATYFKKQSVEEIIVNHLLQS